METSIEISTLETLRDFIQVIGKDFFMVGLVVTVEEDTLHSVKTLVAAGISVMVDVEIDVQIAIANQRNQHVYPIALNVV